MNDWHAETIDFWLKEFEQSGTTIDEEIEETKGTIENEKCFYAGGHELSLDNIAMLERYLKILEEKRNNGAL